jgi:hypothetical protein
VPRPARSTCQQARLRRRRDLGPSRRCVGVFKARLQRLYAQQQQPVLAEQIEQRQALKAHEEQETEHDRAANEAQELQGRQVAQPAHGARAGIEPSLPDAAQSKGAT